MTIQQRVGRFVVENFYVSDSSDLTDDTLLVTSGIVDSTGMLEIIAFLEADFGMRIGGDETTPENLGSIARIAAFVERKLAAAPSRADDDLVQVPRREGRGALLQGGPGDHPFVAKIA